MNGLHLRAAGLVVSVLALGACAENEVAQPEFAQVLIGKWEVTKGDLEVTEGTVMEFNKDGKMKITGTTNGQEQSVNAIYKVDGNKLRFTLKNGDEEEKKEPLTIKKLSQKFMVLKSKGENGFEFELKRKK
jgi:uncharacterized protein (TIGR03066 family)